MSQTCSRALRVAGLCLLLVSGVAIAGTTFATTTPDDEASGTAPPLETSSLDSAAPASTENAELDELESTLEALWTTVLETSSTENAFGTGGAAYACWDLGGTVAPFGGNVESCTVEPGTRLFIAGYSAECSTFEGHGTTEAELRTCARESDEQLAPTVTVDGEPVPITEAETPLMQIVLPADNLFGQPEGTEGLSVGHGWVALVDPLTPGTHTIDGVYANGEPAFTTTIIVEPDQSDATTNPT